jgi:uncharacterized protein (TIGR02246 family)
MTNDEVHALVTRQAQAWMSEDIESALADFAADCLFISPGGHWQGHDQIREAARAFFANATGVRVTITRIVFDGRVGAVEWTWQEVQRATGVRHQAEDAIIFELRDGKLVYWREYFDTAQMAQPL